MTFDEQKKYLAALAVRWTKGIVSRVTRVCDFVDEQGRDILKYGRDDDQYQELIEDMRMDILKSLLRNLESLEKPIKMLEIIADDCAKMDHKTIINQLELATEENKYDSIRNKMKNSGISITEISKMLEEENNDE